MCCRKRSEWFKGIFPHRDHLFPPNILTERRLKCARHDFRSRRVGWLLRLLCYSTCKVQLNGFRCFSNVAAITDIIRSLMSLEVQLLAINSSVIHPFHWKCQIEIYMHTITIHWVPIHGNHNLTYPKLTSCPDGKMNGNCEQVTIHRVLGLVI